MYFFKQPWTPPSRHSYERQMYTSWFFSSGKLGKKEKEQNEDVWFWQYLSWHLMPLFARANGEWSQCQRNSSRQKELLRNQNTLQMHLDKWLGISPPTYQQSAALFLLLHSSRDRADLAWAWDAPAPRETRVLICKKKLHFDFACTAFGSGRHSQIPSKSWLNWNA